mmetsp:Transcript_115258/g.264668  ORF Transcript_115258/g.264668 Transcript_115258/m.264668 type:complete len:282 (-) Transcript_115258:109-954(-)
MVTRVREVGVDRVQDLITGKWYKLDQVTGETSRCSERGLPVATFKPGISGAADPALRKATGSMPELRLDASPPSFKVNEKHFGYSQMPRPQASIKAEASCAYLVPEYLHARPTKIASVSRSPSPPKPRKLWPSEVPTYQDTLSSEFGAVLSLKQFSQRSDNLRTYVDLDAARVKNRGAVEDDGSTYLAELRTQRAITAKVRNLTANGPPYNPTQLREKFEARDRQVNPGKWRDIDRYLKEDRDGVTKRRGDRYVMFFAEKDEEERAQREAMEATTTMELTP